jgi:NADH:ubiquinone reductase (non-electrogenic)
MFDVAPHILGAYDKKLYEYATERMTERGVKIATSSTIEKVDRTHIHVKGEAPVPYGILLWVAGNKSVPLVDNLDVKKSEHGLVRVLTDSHLRVKKSGNDGDVYSDVFALGDAADIEGLSMPTTAEVAVQKAKYLVEQLNNGQNTRGKSFVYSNRRLVTYIGNHDGISQGSPVNQPWSGREAWLSWRTGSFTWNRTWRNRASILFAWVLNALFGKDVVRL